MSWNSTGKTVGGSAQLVFTEQQRRGIALRSPPFKGRLGIGELGGRHLSEHAQNVDIGEVLVVLAGGRGSVKDDGAQSLDVEPA